jgi:hypothetical protein
VDAKLPPPDLFLRIRPLNGDLDEEVDTFAERRHQLRREPGSEHDHAAVALTRPNELGEPDGRSVLACG